MTTASPSAVQKRVASLMAYPGPWNEGFGRLYNAHGFESVQALVNACLAPNAQLDPKNEEFLTSKMLAWYNGVPLDDRQSVLAKAWLASRMTTPATCIGIAKKFRPIREPEFPAQKMGKWFQKAAHPLKGVHGEALKQWMLDLFQRDDPGDHVQFVALIGMDPKRLPSFTRSKSTGHSQTDDRINVLQLLVEHSRDDNHTVRWMRTLASAVAPEAMAQAERDALHAWLHRSPTAMISMCDNLTAWATNAEHLQLSDWLALSKYPFAAIESAGSSSSVFMPHALSLMSMRTSKPSFKQAVMKMADAGFDWGAPVTLNPVHASLTPQEQPQTPLSKAVQHGNLGMVRLLLGMGVPLHHPEESPDRTVERCLADLKENPGSVSVDLVNGIEALINAARAKQHVQGVMATLNTKPFLLT